MVSAAGVPDSDSPVSMRILKRLTWLSIAVAILLIILGMLAILLPVEMSIGVVIVVCWLLMISGVVQMIDAFRGTGVWQKIWKFAVAAAYLATGFFLHFHLGFGLVALTLTFLVFLTVQGVIDVMLYFRVRKAGGHGWLLGHGIITLILALMIWRHWPGGSAWVMGTLVGVHMMITGITRLMLALAVRRVEKTIENAA